VPNQSWMTCTNTPGEGAGSALTNSTSATDISPAPQCYSQTYGSMYVGQKWRFTAYGILSTAASSPGTLTLGIYYGGISAAVPLISVSETPTVSASSWWWQFTVYTEIRTVGTSGTAWSQGWFTNPTSATATTLVPMTTTSQTVTVNTTVNSVLTVGATWGSASSSNSVTCEGYTAEQMN
jgi:hypothetical protein